MNLSLLRQNSERERGKTTEKFGTKNPKRLCFSILKIRFANFSTLGLIEYQKHFLSPEV